MKGCRAQSSVIGVVLLLGLVIAATSLVVFIGGTAITDSKEQINQEQAQLELSSVTSDIVEVSAEANVARSVQLSSADGATVDPEAGRLTLVLDKGATKRTLYNQSLGALRVSGESGEIASQGGGVWSKTGENSSIMVSPPELTYRENTLTLPVVRLTGPESVSSSFTLSRQSERIVFPNASATNPITEGEIYLDIKSEYYHAWGRYFQSRTDGAVTYQHADNVARVHLVVPIDENFGSALETVDPNGVSDRSQVEGDVIEGVSKRPLDPLIDQLIEDCESGGCSTVPGSFSGTLSAGEHYRDGDLSLGDGTTFDTTGGNVTLIVDGDLDFQGTGGGPGSENIGVTGPNMVKIYVKGDVSISGNSGVNSAGEADDLRLAVHSSASTVAAASGTPQFTGLIYAPGTELVINGGGACGASGGGPGGGGGPPGGGGGPPGGGGGGGGPPGCDGNIVGSAIVEEADLGGNGKIAYGGSISHSMTLALNPDVKYLHVSESVVEVDG